MFARGRRSKQRFAAIGDLPLESGQVVRHCRTGYRTFGTLDAAGGNAVLLLTWFMGRSAALARHIGPGRLVDCSRYYVVAVDGLGAGVSSSPSNSAAQPGSAFPIYTVRDMVDAERRLAAHLGLRRLHAVVGTSLGGMQVFEWHTAYPDAVNNGVAIAGSPRLLEAERVRWREQAQSAAARPRWRRVAEAAARALVVISPTDQTVNPRPAAEFAHLAHASLLQFEGRGGHDAPSHETDRLWPAVDRFLAG